MYLLNWKAQNKEGLEVESTRWGQKMHVCDVDLCYTHVRSPSLCQHML